MELTKRQVLADPAEVKHSRRLATRYEQTSLLLQSMLPPFLSLHQRWMRISDYFDMGLRLAWFLTSLPKNSVCGRFGSSKGKGTGNSILHLNIKLYSLNNDRRTGKYGAALCRKEQHVGTYVVRIAWLHETVNE